MFRLFMRTLPVLRQNVTLTCEFFTTKNDYLKKSVSDQFSFISKTVNCRFFCAQNDNTSNSSYEESIPESIILETSGGDPEIEKEIRYLLLQIDTLRDGREQFPSNSFFKSVHLKELLQLPSFSQRKKYLLYLFKIEKKRENAQRKKELKQLERGPKPELDIDFTQDYTLGHNNFMLRIYDTTINNFYNYRLTRSMIFGQKIIVDCGYNNDMNLQESKNCAKQLMLLFSENRAHDNPFDLHFCNVDKNSYIMECLNRNIKTLYEPSFPLHIHENSYLDVFSKKQLVYLTPHCQETLQEFDPDDIYIIGALVDKTNSDPLSLGKAKAEGLRVAKLPLDKYLLWGAGSGKSLTINQVLSILLDVKEDGSWENALKHVPRRKLAEFNHAVEKRKFQARIGAFDNNNVKQSSWKPSTSYATKLRQRHDRNRRILTLTDILNEN